MKRLWFNQNMPAKPIAPQPLQGPGIHGLLRGLPLLITLLFTLLAVTSVRAEAPAALTFLGAARTVGGSALLLETQQSKILIDFGMIMGGETSGGNAVRSFDPADIDYVILTHAHSDHAGRIPLLYRRGFRGRVIGTAATKSLIKLTLAAGLTYRDGNGEVLFGPPDVEAVMRNYLSLPYERRHKLDGEVSIRLQDAGHILGSAMIELWVGEGNSGVKIVFTGDMGNKGIPLLREPAVVTEADFIVIEATYGTVWRETAGQEEAFAREISATLAAGGSVLIPAFTLDRTQKALFTLGRLKRRGLIPATTPVFADSSLGGKITRAYRRHANYLYPDVQREMNTGQDPFRFEGLQEVSGATALQAHAEISGAIYVTSSGMLDHGNAPRHLEKMAANPKNLLVIVGWQAPNTLGAALLAGRRRVAIPLRDPQGSSGALPRKEIDIRMRVKRFEMFSNHADACQLLTWLARLPRTKQVFVIHGDSDNTQRLADIIGKNLGFPAVAPERGQRFFLSAGLADHRRRSGSSPCAGLKKTTMSEDKDE